MELKTFRLYIRNLREDDWTEMKSLFIDFNNSKYAVYDRPLPTEDMEVEALTKQFAETNLFFAIYLLDKDQMIGYVCFHKEQEKYDLGYCFHSAFHSNGYAYESTKALIDYFVQEYNVTTFTAGTAIDNVPSCKLLEKLGFACVSTEYLSFNKEFSFEGGNFILNRSKSIKSGRIDLKEDRIISALIGLTGACNNNPKTAGTDSLVIKALAFPLLCPEYEDRDLQEIVNDIYLEKNAIAPGCASCTAPCGNTSDYDMRRIYEADDGIRNAKLRVLAKIQELAAYVCQCQKNGTTLYMDSSFFYKVLSYVSYDMDEAALLGLLNEAENIERDIKAGVIRNDSKDYKN